MFFFSRLEKPILSCSHCGHEYNLSDRVPKITQCNHIVCLACLKSAPVSTNQLNYACQFHLIEHQINGGFESLPEPLGLKKKIEYNEFKVKIASFEEGNINNNIRLEIDLQVESVINNIKKMQIEMHKNLDLQSSDYDVENFKKVFHEIDSDMEQIDSSTDLSSKRLQELNNKIDNNLKRLRVDFGRLVPGAMNVRFEKSEKNFTFQELIGTLIHSNQNLTSKNSFLPKWKLNYIKAIKHQAFSLIISICQFTATNQLVITDQLGKCLHVFDGNKFNYIKSVTDSQFGHLTGICQLKDLEQLCVVDKQKPCLYLIDKTYQKVKSKSLESSRNGKIFSYLDVDYDCRNGFLYLCDTSTSSTRIMKIDKNLNDVMEVQLSSLIGYANSMRVMKEQVFISDGFNNKIHVFNAKLEYLISFGDRILKSPTDFLISNEHVYVFEHQKSFIKVFNHSNYEKNDFECKLNNDKTHKAVIFGNNLLINSANTEILVYEILN